MYISEGKIFFNESPIQTISAIPTGNWLVCFNSQTNEYYLKEKPSFELPNKLYGDCEELSNKILNTWNHRNKNMGVLLAGMKGTGKSLLARVLCINSKLPILIITDSFGGTGFIDFLSKINQEMIIFIDEFEKIYDEGRKSQESLLSVLDGGFPSKFLFLLTINEIDRVNEYLMNRPSRIHYLKTYAGLSEEIIIDIINDKLNNKEQSDNILEITRYLGEISMDIIISIIEECNIYPNETPKDLLKLMNLRPDSNGYEYTISIGGVIIDKSYCSNSPLTNSHIYLEFNIDYNEKIDSLLNEYSKVFNSGLESNDSYDEDEDVFEPIFDEEDKPSINSRRKYYEFSIPLKDSIVNFDNKSIVIKHNEITLKYTKPNNYTYTL